MTTDSKVVPLISEEEIRKRIEELAAKISEDYLNRELLVVGVLKGAWVFMADLVRRLTIPVKCDFLGVASYGSGSKSSGVVRIVSDLTSSVEGKDVLLVEDIVDTGLTLNFLKDTLWLRRPKSLKVCALLDKPARHIGEVHIDYLGF
ncbi:MAG TPA: hypoxanthine phosphoribosyltransferase, partial [Candidatus Latescibacteria bacterium]|nr:hypoxanthine phosphoribosyltransferase [Candidatus Latescibacterota bacterium]